jgi:C_GCAxxG_C_C family probable redox protein
LASFSEELGLGAGTALKLAGGFGAGMGQLGKTCGAVTGALMVIGLKYGKDLTGDEAAKQKTYRLVRDFINKFEAQNGTTVCRELIGYDLTTEEGLKAARASGVFQRACLKYIRDAIAILETPGF